MKAAIPSSNPTVTRASYTVFDSAITVMLVAVIVAVLHGVAHQLGGNAEPAPSESQPPN